MKMLNRFSRKKFHLVAADKHANELIVALAAIFPLALVLQFANKSYFVADSSNVFIIDDALTCISLLTMNKVHE